MEILDISTKKAKRKGFTSKQASALRKKRNFQINSLSYGPELRNPGVVTFARAGRLDVKQQ